MAKKYYAVKVGKVPGIYLSWEECQEQIKGISGAIYKGFSSPTDAQNFLNQEVEKPAPKSYYAVKVGKTPGIYTTWEECYAQIEHFPNASYKKFPTLEDAESFMGTETNQFNGAVAHLGGVCDDSSFDFGYAAIIHCNGTQEIINGSGYDVDLENLKTFAGELVAATKVMDWCIKNHIPELKICYTYDGVDKWATGEWKPNNVGAKKYARYCQYASSKLHIQFKKTNSNDDNIVEAKRQAQDAFIRRDK